MILCSISNRMYPLSASEWLPAWVRSCFPRERKASVTRCQPLGGVNGQAEDIKIHAEWILKTREKLNRILSDNTGQPLEQIEKDTDRDNFMGAQEAASYGLIDKVVASR